MDGRLTRVEARNFRSLTRVDLRLGDLTVLIGPNGSGKTNVLNVLRFLATTVRFDLAAAPDVWRGHDHVQRQAPRSGAVTLAVEGLITPYSSHNAPDRYVLRLRRSGKTVSRTEEFTVKRRSGRGRRITVNGDLVTITEGGDTLSERRLATKQTTGLATLPKLADEDGGLGIRLFTEFLSSIRVLEPNVDEARSPARQYGASLAADATVAISSRLAGRLSSIGGMPVVPVQTIEAWWFLELIAQPSAELCRVTRTRRAPEYTEADSPVIAGDIRRLGLSPLHPCASYDRMTTIARSIR